MEQQHIYEKAIDKLIQGKHQLEEALISIRLNQRYHKKDDDLTFNVTLEKNLRDTVIEVQQYIKGLVGYVNGRKGEAIEIIQEKP